MRVQQLRARFDNDNPVLGSVSSAPRDAVEDAESNQLQVGDPSGPLARRTGGNSPGSLRILARGPRDTDEVRWRVGDHCQSGR
jgi:hypothetical protein